LEWRLIDLLIGDGKSFVTHDYDDYDDYDDY
jgi:hypothetical protein